jgi:hypothetical protein
MRCPKCGYISFDHLNQCTQCQTDLTGEKLRLNLPNALADPISVQEIKERAFGPARPVEDKTQISKAYIPEPLLDGDPAPAQKSKTPPSEKPVIEISMEDFDLGPLK